MRPGAQGGQFDVGGSNLNKTTMAGPGMGQMGGMGVQNLANMPHQMTPQQQQQLLLTQQHQMAQLQQQHQQQIGLSPQQIMMHQQMGHIQTPLNSMLPQQQQTTGIMPGQQVQQLRPQIVLPQQALQTPHPNPEMNPIHQAKFLVPHLKEAFSNLMKVTAQSIHQNGLIDSCSKSSENTSQKFDKFLEEFYAVCDQIELNLRLSIETTNASADSLKHTPLPVQTGRQDPSQPESYTYVQFLSLVRMQAAQAKDVKDLIVESMKKISDHPT